MKTVGKQSSGLFYRSKPIVGLDFNRTGIRVVSTDKDKMIVHGYGSVDLDPSKISDEIEQSNQYLHEKMQELLEENIIGKLDSNRIALGVPAMKTFSRTFTLPVTQEAHIEDAINLEIEQYIAMPPESLYVDHQIISRTKTEIVVLMCAVPKRYLDSLLDVMRSAGLEVAVVEPSANAIVRLLEFTKEGGMGTVIIDVGPANTDIAVFDGVVRVTGGLAVGGNTLTLDLAKKMSISLENAHQLKVLNGLGAGPRQEKIVAALRPSLMKIVTETRKVMRFYTERSENGATLEQVLIVGSGSGIPGLGEFFTNELVMAARVASPWQALNFSNITQPSKQSRPRFMTAAGLSLINQQEQRT